MLRSDFRFPVVRWPQRLVAFLLGESFLGFLAIVAVGLTLFPILFDVSPAAHAALDTLQWTIIAWFAVEYVVALFLAPSKRAFLLSPWRLIDLATILVPLAALLPNVSQAVLSSPVLRLVRLVRLVTLGVRVSGVAVRHRAGTKEERMAETKLEIVRLADEAGVAPRPATWDELLAWLKSPGPDWFHATGLAAEQLAAIAKAAELPAGFLENHLVTASYPHLARARQATAAFLWLPEIPATGAVERLGGLFVLKGKGVLSLTRRPAKTLESMAVTARMRETELASAPFAVRVLGLAVQTVIHRNEELAGRLEQELRGLEEVPMRESGAGFFERTFRTKKELSAAQADLWRLKGVIADLAAGRGLPDQDEAVTEVFRRLATDAEYLYETVVNVRDEVLSVLELHLNIVSFDMNRVMRVLAVVSVLGLIPAVIGGLFGMNLIDNPWPFTLPQVAFGVSFGMVLCVYFFFVKGWLR